MPEGRRPVAVAVGERADVDLVGDGLAPPRLVGAWTWIVPNHHGVSLPNGSRRQLNAVGSTVIQTCSAVGHQAPGRRRRRWWRCSSCVPRGGGRDRRRRGSPTTGRESTRAVMLPSTIGRSPTSAAQAPAQSRAPTSRAAPLGDPHRREPSAATLGCGVQVAATRVPPSREDDAGHPQAVARVAAGAAAEAGRKRVGRQSRVGRLGGPGHLDRHRRARRRDRFRPRPVPRPRPRRSRRWRPRPAPRRSGRPGAGAGAAAPRWLARNPPPGRRRDRRARRRCSRRWPTWPDPGSGCRSPGSRQAGAPEHCRTGRAEGQPTPWRPGRRTRRPRVALPAGPGRLDERYEHVVRVEVGRVVLEGRVEAVEFVRVLPASVEATQPRHHAVVGMEECGGEPGLGSGEVEDG